MLGADVAHNTICSKIYQLFSTCMTGWGLVYMTVLVALPLLVVFGSIILGILVAFYVIVGVIRYGNDVYVVYEYTFVYAIFMCLCVLTICLQVYDIYRCNQSFPCRLLQLKYPWPDEVTRWFISPARPWHAHLRSARTYRADRATTPHEYNTSHRSSDHRTPSDRSLSNSTRRLGQSHNESASFSAIPSPRPIPPPLTTIPPAPTETTTSTTTTHPIDLETGEIGDSQKRHSGRLPSQRLSSRRVDSSKDNTTTTTSDKAHDNHSGTDIYITSAGDGDFGDVVNNLTAEEQL